MNVSKGTTATTGKIDYPIDAALFADLEDDGFVQLSSLLDDDTNIKIDRSSCAGQELQQQQQQQQATTTAGDSVVFDDTPLPLSRQEWNPTTVEESIGVEFLFEKRFLDANRMSHDGGDDGDDACVASSLVPLRQLSLTTDEINIACCENHHNNDDDNDLMVWILKVMRRKIEWKRIEEENKKKKWQQ